MKKRNIILLVFGCIMVNLLFVGLLVFYVAKGFDDVYEITTNITEYDSVIGKNAKDKYKDKWGMSEEIFPSSIKDLNVSDFKMVYYDPWDKQFLSYLVIDYAETFDKEVERLNSIGITKYIGNYGVSGFTKYNLLAMNSDSYNGFIYAITDGKSKIIYVELIFCNYYMDIKYDEQIPLEYLPDDFDAHIDNEYSKRLRNL